MFLNVFSSTGEIDLVIHLNFTSRSKFWIPNFSKILLEITITRSTPSSIRARFNRILLNHLHRVIEKLLNNWINAMLFCNWPIYKLIISESSTKVVGRQLRIPADTLFGRPEDHPIQNNLSHSKQSAKDNQMLRKWKTAHNFD